MGKGSDASTGVLGKGCLRRLTQRQNRRRTMERTTPHHELRQVRKYLMLQAPEGETEEAENRRGT